MFENIQVGDKAYSCLAGWGEVRKVGRYGFSVDFETSGKTKWFNIDGKNNTFDINPEITEIVKNKWQPKGGLWGLHLKHKDDGAWYDSAPKADKARALVRQYQRLVSYVIEHISDCKYLDNEYWTVVYDQHLDKWVYDRFDDENLITVFMPEDVASKLAQKLNSGEVEL